MPRLPWLAGAYSFDLFDTLLGRCYARPIDLFGEIERRLALQLRPAPGFAHLRELCELELRRRGNFRREVGLKEIYAELAHRLAQDSSWQERALALELEIEGEVIFAVPSALALLRRARRRGRRILLISDTYFPRTFLEPLLYRLQVMEAGDRLFLSSESGLMKSTGELFAHVAAVERLAPGRIFHVGDNEASDCKQAMAAGWKAIRFAPTEPNRYESPIDPRIPADDALRYSLFQGVRRKLRLCQSYPTGHQQTIYNTTIAVSAPLLIAYTAWCLREAHRRGLSRLYFLSRDGEILFKIAQRLQNRLRLPVALQYLHVSRQALLLPVLAEPVEPELSWILAPTAVLTLRMALRRVDMIPESEADGLAASGFPSSTWDRQLDQNDRERLGQWICSEAVRARLVARAESARTKALAYLVQHGLLTDPDFALVDIGWKGTLQSCISRLLATTGRTQGVTGFYWGLHHRRRHKAADVMLSYFTDHENPTRADSIGYLVPLLELFAAARHGGVSGYEMNGDKVEPFFRSPENSSGLAWGVEIQQRAMLDLTEAWCAQPGFDFDSTSLVGTLTDNLERLARDPSPAEARAYGSYLDAEDQNEAVFTPLARPYSLDELKRHRDTGYVHHHNEWPAGAVALTPWLYRRWLSVENHLDEQHPVCGSGILPLRGFGPVEGPVAQFHLPRFMWAYGPECILQVTAVDQTNPMLRLRLKNFHGAQYLEFILAGVSLTKLEVPQNFGEVPIEPFIMELVLPCTHGTHELTIRPRYWSKEDRPLAVIFCGVEIVKPNSSPNPLPR